MVPHWVVGCWRSVVICDVETVGTVATLVENLHGKV